MKKLRIKPGVVDRAREWIAERGGIAVWNSVWLTDPSYQVLTPAMTDGKPSEKPSWKVGDKPEVVTDPSLVEVAVPKEVKRLHICIRQGTGNPFMFKLTDTSSARVHRALEKFGRDAWYEFDADECVIFVPDRLMPLVEFGVGIEEKH